MEKQIKVIICADDGEWSRENTDALASRGAQVVTVNRNGTALLTKIRDEKPDVVVMDLFMAGVDALGVMHAVKAEGLPKPVFIITAAHSSNAKCRARWLCYTKQTIKNNNVNFSY